MAPRTRKTQQRVCERFVRKKRNREAWGPAPLQTAPVPSGAKQGGGRPCRIRPEAYALGSRRDQGPSLPSVKEK